MLGGNPCFTTTKGGGSDTLLQFFNFVHGIALSVKD
jgi:hypothetical protein